MKKRNIICLLLAVLMLLACTACGGKTSTGDTAGTRTITDSKNRTVTIPDKVERVVCVGVAAHEPGEQGGGGEAELVEVGPDGGQGGFAAFADLRVVVDADDRYLGIVHIHDILREGII